MITALLLLASILFLLFRHYSNANKKWALRGISGPPPSLLYGNIRDIWNFEKPRSIVVRDWTKVYGKMYGFYEGQRPFIVVSNFETINEIVVKKFDHFNARARFILQTREDGPNTKIIEARGPHWKRLRALGSIAFTPKSLRNILSTVNESAATLVDEIQRRQGAEIDALQYFQEYTLDVTCRVVLGMRNVKMFNNDLIHACRKIINRPLSSFLTVIPALFPFALDVFIGGLLFLGKLAPKRSNLTALTTVLKNNIDEKRRTRLKRSGLADGQQSDAHRDFIDIFLDAEVDETEVQFGETSDTSRKLSADEIVIQCLVFLLAGFDTSSNSLSFLTHFLANHQDIQKKLIDEIDSFLIENETIELERLNDLTYLDAVIRESLRHFPLASAVVSRECTRACEIGGFQFEIGDMVQTDTWSMHMDPQVWGEDASEFRPERWLEPSSRPRAAFQSFGEGPRACLGVRLAYIEEKVAMIKLLSKFTIQKTANTNPLNLVGSLTIAPERVAVRLVAR